MKGLKFLMAFVLAGSMLVGCGSSSDTKTFRFSSELDIQSLDSSQADDGMSFNALHAFTEGLMDVDKDGKTTTAIAKSYTKSSDGLTYTFKIRDDAKWSNGDKIVAGDFVYACHKVIKDAGGYAYMLGDEGAGIKNADQLSELGGKATTAQLNTLGVKAIDESTVVFTLNQQCPYFLDLMTFPCFYPMNQKFVEKCGSKYATAPQYTISCGAFKLSKWTKSSKITFVKNDKFYGKEDVKLDKLEMYLAQDPKTAATNFDTGKLDYCTINSSLVDKYKNKDTYTKFAQGYIFYLSLNFKNKYLANKNIRAALSYAIDRSSLCSDVLKDGSKEANGLVDSGLCYSPSGVDFRKQSGDFTTYNLKKAQDYFDKGLKELGVSSINLRLMYGTDESPMDTEAQYLQGAFSKIKGLKISMVATIKNVRVHTKQAKGDYDISCTRWGPDYADPTTFLNLLLTGNINNYGKYSNAAYDALIKKAQKATDTTTRWNDLVQAEQIAMKDYGYIPVFEKGGSALQKTNVSGLVYKVAVGSAYTFTYVEKK